MSLVALEERFQDSVEVSFWPYRRSGFNCEYANCEFISSSQKLERKKKMYAITTEI